MKRFILIPLLLTCFLGNGQGKKELSIVNFGLCNVNGQDCNKQPGKSIQEWPSGWIEIGGGSGVKIYYSGSGKIEQVADITLTETIFSNDSYGVYKGYEKLLNHNTTLEVIVRIEYPTTNFQRTVVYYHNPGSTLGHYYICRPRN